MLGTCILATDMLRPCDLYRSLDKVFTDSDELIETAWVVCPPGTRPLTVPSKFGSRIWLNENIDYSHIGEWALKPHPHSRDHANYPTGVGCYQDAAVFTDGLTQEAKDNPLGLCPDCCIPTYPDAECVLLTEEGGRILDEDYGPLMMEQCLECGLLTEEGGFIDAEYGVHLEREVC